MTADHDDDLGARLRALGDDGWDPVAPPPLQPFQPRRRRRLALAVAAAAATVGSVVLGGGGSPAIALAPLDAAPAGARATLVEDGGRVRLTVTGARPTPAGFDEELWYLGEGDEMVSLGMYRVGRDGRADVSFAATADPRDYRFVDTSLEPRDGDPAHSTKSLLRSARLD